MRKKTKRVCGIGVNDSTSTIVGCPFYRTWKAMLRRCYIGDSRSNAYLNCTVSDDWLVFSNFKAWMEKQDWQGRQLDKDLLSEGSKVYSPETCVFVSQEFNKFMCTIRPNNKGLPIGVLVVGGKFTAEVSSRGKKVKLGTFETKEAAHAAWKSAKLKIASNFSEFSDKRIRESLFEKFSVDKALKEEDTSQNEGQEEKENASEQPRSEAHAQGQQT